MLPFKLIYSDDYYLPIGSHVFPAEKYRRIRDRLLAAGIAATSDFVAPRRATDRDVLLVHTPQYVEKLKTGTLSAREQLELEVPYSPELVSAFWLHAGGSILAADHALNDGAGFNLGGGFHHAFRDHGEGFCVVHDVAIAIRRMQRDGKIHRAMTVDCDVHQGNGTAAIFAGTRTASQPLPPVPAVSLHPGHSTRASSAKSRMHSGHSGDVSPSRSTRKITTRCGSRLLRSNVDLPDGIGDDDYLGWLDNALSSGLRQFEPELLCYVAGADPYREDQLGGLGLTIEGLKKRDELVFCAAKSRGIPVMVTLAGGYARNVEDTVTIHCNTVVAAKEAMLGTGPR